MPDVLFWVLESLLRRGTIVYIGAYLPVARTYLPVAKDLNQEIGRKYRYLPKKTAT